VSRHWTEGSLRDDEPVPSSAWQRILSVIVLVWLFDLALGLRASPAEQPDEASAAALRETLREATAEAEAGHRSLLLIGDSVLAGDVLADERPDDWGSQRVLDHMRRELGPHANARVDQIALDGLLPVDALRLVTELDRIDPAATVELVIELNLRFFSAQYARERDCTRPAICELGLDPRHSFAGAAVAARDRLHDWTPVHRHRAVVAAAPLDQIPGLAVARTSAPEPEPKPRAEAEARVREHYRSASINLNQPIDHAQLAALAELLERVAARGRPTTLFLTPLADSFAERSLTAAKLGARYAALARLVNDHGAPELALINLDHPLFVDAHFIDHVHLGVEGSRLLAINLIHELNLPLAHRPFEAQMIHPEGHDRTLVHRVDRGYLDGGAWQALFDRPEGVAVSRDGARIVVADTHNHVLRELRGNMQMVETIAGKPNKAGRQDGRARAGARLEHPRGPALLGDALWFIDGRERADLRVLERDFVRTPVFRGPSCPSYRAIRTDDHERGAGIWALCDDGRLLYVDLARAESRLLSEHRLAPIVAFDVADHAVYFADIDGRLWRRELSYANDGRPTLGSWSALFANTGEALLPHGPRVGYPYDYDELRLAKVVDLRWIERYGGLLIADEFPLPGADERLQRALTERVHLRYFDLDAARILPWIKAVPHGDAYALRNEAADQIVSYWHVGSMAVAQDDASLVWLERDRSRLLRVADGLLGVAKTGNHHTRVITLPLMMTIAGVARTVDTQMRPDRFLDRRHEPLAREGPYVAALFGSSLSSMSDRLSNYSLGRRLELELQRELGYREGVRLDLFQVSWPASSFVDNVNNFSNWMSTSVPPDVVFIEVNDFGGGSAYLKRGKDGSEAIPSFAKLERLAARYDTLVVFYDLSSMEANRRDGMRSTDKQVRELLDQAKQLGFVVLDPGDRLLPELLRNSPWGNQPFGENQHHGSPWAIDITAQTLAAMSYPILREFLRDRVPARWRERPPADFEAQAVKHDPLRRALDRVALDPNKLPPINPSFIQTELVNGELRVHVDLAGFGGAAEHDGFDVLAVAVIDQVLRGDVYAELADSLLLELVEFRNYNEYGDGVVDSAKPRWTRKFDRAALEAFLAAHQPG